MNTAPKQPQPATAEGGAAGRLRKKGTWLRVDPNGQTQEVETGKHEIMRRTCLSAKYKYLRILDLVLSYRSTILARERAILVNLEHIKAIITAQEVMFLNSRNPFVPPLINNLQRIFRHRQSAKAPQANAEITQQEVAEKEYGLKTLPFEFVALEACLDVACTALDNEASRLEQEARPVLDTLTALNSERARLIQSRSVALTGRVQQVRDRLKLLLVDEEDMTKMCLTRKLEEQLDNSSIDVKEFKMILQAYLVQTDGTLQKLSDLREYGIH